MFAGTAQRLAQNTHTVAVDGMHAPAANEKCPTYKLFSLEL
jgi:hypothetical protein